MQLQLTHSAAQLTDAPDFAEQLGIAMTGLETAERAAHALAELGPEHAAHAYLSACDEAGLAIRELLAIPAVGCPEETYLSEGGAPESLVLAITDLAEEIARTLMSAANKTTAYRSSCLAAAEHACRLAKALVSL